eukprot:COSAG02_NODE_4316_length_5512_cov_72.504188_1_plen_49_part_00
MMRARLHCGAAFTIKPSLSNLCYNYVNTNAITIYYDYRCCYAAHYDHN